MRRNLETATYTQLGHRMIKHKESENGFSIGAIYVQPPGALLELHDWITMRVITCNAPY